MGCTVSGRDGASTASRAGGTERALSFFFFQAEDGIRDLTVTGVQTCALPILRRLQEQLDLLAQYEAANAEIVRHTPSVLPLPPDQFVLTSPFGNRVSPFTRTADFHKEIGRASCRERV